MTLADDGRKAEAHPVADDRLGEIARVLDRLLANLDEAWTPDASIPRRLRDLQERLRDERLQLAILGQFKRGKSTFLNALLGAPLLPTGVIPLTAIPTFIAWAEKPLIRVTYQTARPPDEFAPATPDEIRDRLHGFVAEEGNPKNCLQVARVDLLYPAAILRNGVVLIDTPGIGSSHRHNTDTALRVLPECDAALFVISADPPITEVELAYLETARAHVARLFFVLNKADYLEPRDLEAAVAFLRQTLRQSLRLDANPTIFRVSARAGLRAKESGSNAALAESGIADVEEHLLRYLSREKLASLRAAVIGKSAELAAEAEADLAFRVRTLEMPLADLAQRRATLEKALGRIAGEGRIIHDLLSGDRRRAIEQLEMHAEQLRQRGRDYLAGVLDRALAQGKQTDPASAAQAAIAAAIPEFFERELGDTAREFRGTVEDILAGHQRRIDDLVNLVRRTAADLFDVPYAASAESELFKLGREPYWVTQRLNDRLVALPPGALDRFLPTDARRARLRARLLVQSSELVQNNVENLRWATLQGLDNTFRRFVTALDQRLAGAIAATQGAVAAAAAKRATQSEDAAGELAALRRIAAELAAIKDELARLSDRADRRSI
jgi:GTPase SAR1 family protein